MCRKRQFLPYLSGKYFSKSHSFAKFPEFETSSRRIRSSTSEFVQSVFLGRKLILFSPKSTKVHPKLDFQAIAEGRLNQIRSNLCFTVFFVTMDTLPRDIWDVIFRLLLPSAQGIRLLAHFAASGRTIQSIVSENVWKHSCQAWGLQHESLDENQTWKNTFRLNCTLKMQISAPNRYFEHKLWYLRW